MKPDSDAALHIEAFNITHGIEDAAHQTLISHLLIEPPRLAVEGASRSRGWAKLTSKTVLPVSEYRAAISDMLNRDLIWEIDDDKRTLITEYLGATPALGPTGGMPEIGTLQISIRFANLLDELWTGIVCERPGVLWSRDWQSDKLHMIYSPTRKGCLDFLRDELADDDECSFNIERITGPEQCGPWRCQWWRIFESGYVLAVHYV